MENKYRCIDCGANAERLYHDYKNGIMKIEHCKCCGEVVDKYIEFDPVIISLDALLLKRRAFRHVLYNSSIQGYWKLTVIIIFCDAFVKLAVQRSKGEATPIHPDYVIYSALEWGLYWNFLLSLMELFSKAIMILSLITVCRCCEKQKPTNISSIRNVDILKAIILSSFGKVLMIPAVLWGVGYNPLYVWLTKLFICMSNIQALRVTIPSWTCLQVSIIVIIGHIFSTGVSVLFLQLKQ